MHALLTGCVLGVVGMIINFISYSLSDPLHPNILMGILLFAVGMGLNILVMIFALKNWRDLNGGYIKYGKAFGYTAIMGIYSAILISIFTLLYVTVINPAFIETQLDATRQMYENMNIPDSQVEMSMSFANRFMTPVFMTVSALFVVYIGAIIDGLIAAAIAKKDPPVVMQQVNDKFQQQNQGYQQMNQQNQQWQQQQQQQNQAWQQPLPPQQEQGPQNPPNPPQN